MKIREFFKSPKKSIKGGPVPGKNSLDVTEKKQSQKPQDTILLPFRNMFYIIALAIILFWLLKIFKILFIVITLSIFCSFMLNPIVEFFVKKIRNKGLSPKKIDLHRTYISIIVSSIFAFLFAFIAFIIINNLIVFFGNVRIYENQLNIIINDIINDINSVIIRQDILPDKISIPAQRFSIRHYLINTISLNFYLNSANSFFTFLVGIFLIFVFIFFILNESERTKRKIKHILIKKKDVYQSINKSIITISSKIYRYLQIKLFISLFTAFLSWLVLSAFQVENSFTLAFFTFAFNFIPNIGSIAITLLITVMAVIQFYPDWNMPVIIGLLITSIQIVIGNILDPKLQGDQLDLSPVLILISLAFWGYIWGIAGLFLAVPMLEVVRITCNNIKGLQSIAVFLSSGKNIEENQASQETGQPSATGSCGQDTSEARLH